MARYPILQGGVQSCAASPQRRIVQIRHWLEGPRQPRQGVPAKYAVYESGNARRPLGAGNCPPSPQVAHVPIPENVAFTVQAIENNIELIV